MDKKAFDIEYSTMWRKEVDYLKSRGIEPSFVKHTPGYHVKQYKYTKTPELFVVLFDFYNQERLNKEFNAVSSEFSTVEQTSPENVVEYDTLDLSVGMKDVVDKTCLRHFEKRVKDLV